MNFFDNLKTITPEKNLETRQIDSISSFIFSALPIFNIQFFFFENMQNSFSCGLTFALFCSVTYLYAGQKLQIRTAHYTFLESRHSEVIKNTYYVLSRLGSQKKKVSAPRL